MHGIFISYRRGGSAPFARALYNELAAKFGHEQVFMDVEDLREPGKDFVDEIQFSLDRCAAMLTLIGKDWVDTRDKDGAVRLHDPKDFVRLEIATALKRDVRVIPVLLEGARMPEEDDLPEDLTSLARRQALKLAHESWDHNVSEMVDWLGRIPGLELKPPPGPATPPPKKSRVTLVAAIAVAGIAIGAAVLISGSRTLAPDPRLLQKTESEKLRADVDTGRTRAASEPQRTVKETASPAPQYSADVYRVQQLLNDLDYDAGPADGYIGPATVAAIREFESDEGYRVRGNVTDSLLARLEEALEDESYQAIQSYAPTVSAPPNTAVAASAPNISGVWYDNAGRPVVIEQNGSNVRVGTMNILTGEVFQIGVGNFQNGMVTINYSNAGSTGTVVATLAPDGRHLNGTDTDAMTGYSVANSWHYDHLPSH